MSAEQSISNGSIIAPKKLVSRLAFRFTESILSRVVNMKPILSNFQLNSVPSFVSLACILILVTITSASNRADARSKTADCPCCWHPPMEIPSQDGSDNGNSQDPSHMHFTHVLNSQKCFITCDAFTCICNAPCENVWVAPSTQPFNVSVCELIESQREYNDCDIATGTLHCCGTYEAANMAHDICDNSSVPTF